MADYAALIRPTCVTPYLESGFAQVAKLAVTEFSKRAPAYVAAWPPTPGLAQCFGASNTDIAELMLIKVGECLPGTPALQPTPARAQNSASPYDCSFPKRSLFLLQK
jgi:hypothetical protein